MEKGGPGALGSNFLISFNKELQGKGAGGPGALESHFLIKFKKEMQGKRRPEDPIFWEQIPYFVLIRNYRQAYFPLLRRWCPEPDLNRHDIAIEGF